MVGPKLLGKYSVPTTTSTPYYLIRVGRFLLGWGRDNWEAQQSNGASDGPRGGVDVGKPARHYHHPSIRVPLHTGSLAGLAGLACWLSGVSDSQGCTIC